MITLKQILYNALVRSRILNDNFTDMKNTVNDLQSQIDNLATPPAGTEVTNARDYHTVLRDRLRSASRAQGNVFVEGGEVTAQGTPDMTVHIDAGEALVYGVACKWAAMDSATITAPSSNPRYDIVVVNSDNTVDIVTGTEAASPVLPTLSATQLAAASIRLETSTTTITQAMIRDMREFSSTGGGGSDDSFLLMGA